jgi:hypothetical protein
MLHAKSICNNNDILADGWYSRNVFSEQPTTIQSNFPKVESISQKAWVAVKKNVSNRLLFCSVFVQEAVGQIK